MTPHRNNRVAVAIIWILAGTLVFVLTLLLSFEFFAKQREVDVSNDRPREFPVVLLRPQGPEITLVNSFELDDSFEGSFRILPADLPSVNEKLRAWQEDRGAKGIPEIDVQQSTEDTQLISLEIHTDGIFRSTYEAKERGIRPRKLTMAGPFFIFYPAGAAMLVTFGFTALVTWITRRWRV